MLYGGKMRAIVTKGLVAKAIEEIRARGDNPSSRKVLEITGGDPARVQAFMKDLAGEAALSVDDDNDDLAILHLMRPVLEKWAARKVAAPAAKLISVTAQVDELMACKMGLEESLKAANEENSRIRSLREEERAGVFAAERRAAQAEVSAANTQLSFSQMELRAVEAEKRVMELEEALAKIKKGTSIRS
jgi:hypothetical protein